MFNKGGLFLVVLVATGLVPYLLSSSTGLTNLAARVLPVKGAGEASPFSVDEALLDGAAAPAAGADPKGWSAAHRNEVRVHAMEDVLRFDITTAWVLANWPRVSAGLAELDLQGYRVPVVTGASEADLAGSLTYYFNPRQRVQRIVFSGSTGDARRLVSLVESRYQLKRKITPDPSLFLYEHKEYGQVTSELRIRPAPVVRSGAPHGRFAVALTLGRPAKLD